MQIDQKDYNNIKQDLSAYKKFEKQRSGNINSICLIKFCAIVLPIVLIFKPGLLTAIILAAILVFSGVIDHNEIEEH